MPSDYQTNVRLYGAKKANEIAEQDSNKRQKLRGNEPAPAPTPRNPDVVPPNDPDDPGAGTSEDVEMASFGGGGRTDGSESSVDPWGNARLRPYQETQNCIMPYYAHGTLTIATGTAASSVAALALRLNSIYDCLTISTYSADPTPAADTADGTVQKPQMFAFWSGLYRYWTVIKSHYHLHVFCDSRSASQEISCWTYHNGQQQPPLVADAGTDNVTDAARRTHKHAHHQYLHDEPIENGKSYYQQGIHIKGEYRQGNYTVHNDVAEDEFKETWHKVTEVPSMREVATMIFQRSDFQRFVRTDLEYNLKYRLWVTYYVQWKDLVVKFQYPTQETDFAATTDPWANI